jgi:hypothetical protein
LSQCNERKHSKHCRTLFFENWSDGTLVVSTQQSTTT